MMRSILMVSPEPWSGSFVSKHHYAISLAEKGAQVVFLEPPNSSVRAISVRRSNRFPRISIVSAPRVARGLRFCPAFARRLLERWWLHRLERRLGFALDTVWLFENSRFFDMGFANPRLKIYHQVDLNQDYFPALAARTSDIAFCTTDVIKKKLSAHQPNVHKIHHGCSSAMFLPINRTSISDRFNGHKLNAVCIGNLDIEYLDVDLILKLVEIHDNLQFHFVGQYSEAGKLRAALGVRDNITWWGQIDYSLIPEVLSGADILMVTYRADLYREQLASPHKFMEYFASGKVVVASYTDEYKDKRHLLEMANSAGEYEELFAKVAANIQSFNSLAMQNARRQFAEDHLYQIKVDNIMSLIRKSQLVER